MKLPFRKSIKSKLALLVLAIIPIGISLGIINSNIAKNKISQKNKELLELRSVLVANKIEKTLEINTGILKSVDADRQKILLTNIIDNLGDLRFGETGYIILVDREGQVLAHPHPAFQVEGELPNLADLPPVRNLLENGEKDFNFVDKESQHWIWSGTRLQNGWGAIAIISRGEFLSEGEEISETMLLFGALIAVTLALLVWGLGSHLISPITQLNKAAIAISNGKYTHLSINRADEFGSLALSFNQLVKMLFEVNSQLERKLAQQTSDLRLRGEKLTLALKAAKANEKATERFNQNIVHQTILPLNAIVARSNDPTGNNLTVKECALYLRSILGNLTDCNTGKIVPKHSEVDLHQLVDVAIDTVKLNLKNQVRVRSQLSTNLPAIETDSFRLLQVLFNLLSNSVKFTSIGSITLNIKCLDSPCSDRILFEIKDTGTPMNIRNDNSLRNAREILEALGSQLKVKNRDTTGACFDFELLVEKNKSSNSDEWRRSNLSLKQPRKTRSYDRRYVFTK